MSSSSYNPDPNQPVPQRPDPRTSLEARPSASPFAESIRVPAASPVSAALAGSAIAPSTLPSDAPPIPPRFRPQILRSLKMHPRAAIVCGAFVFLAIVYVAFMQGKVYQAQSLVYVEPIAARSITDTGSGGFDQFRYGSLLDQQMQTVTRQDVLTAALRTLPARTWARPKESEQTAVLRLQKALVVERVLTSYQMAIRLKTDSAQAAALIVNAVTRAYLESGRSDEVNASKERQNLLFEERQRIGEQLVADQREQMELGNKLGVANPEYSVNNPFDAETTNLRLQLAVARQAHDVAAAQLSSVSGQDSDHKSGLAASADDTLTTDMGLSSLKTAVNARRALLQSQMAGLTPNNTTYKLDQDELADLDRSVDATTAQMRGKAERHIQDKLRTDLERTASIESQLNSQLAQQTAKATGAGPRLQRASELGFDIQRLQAQYSKVDEALHAAELLSNGPGMAHIALEASIPAQPEPSHRNLFLLAAFPLAAAFGCLGAVIARARDLRIYRGDDLEHAIGFAPIAVLPARREVAAPVLDQYILRLAAGIETAYRTAGAQTFIVTAVSPNTETTELVRTLAHKLGHMRLDVTIKRAGDLLIVSQESAEYMVRDHAARSPFHHVAEGVAAVKLDRLKNEHGIVLIDAPPLLHSAETEYAARCADATLLIAESAVTLTTEIADAGALLARLRIRGIAAVLVDVSMQYADPSFLAAVQIAEHRATNPAASEPSNHAAARPYQTAPKPAPVPQPAPESTPVAASVVLNETPAATPTPRREPREVADSRDAREFASNPAVPTAFERFRSPAAEAMLKGFLDADPSARPEAPFERPNSHPAVSHPSASRPSASATLQSVAPAPDITPARSRQHRRLPLVEVDTTGFSAETLEDSRLDEGLHQDDSLGKFVSEEDLVEAVPLYTRSRIRLAFKEEEVNSKTTWFSKLFRGESPSSIRPVAPHTAQEDLEVTTLAAPTLAAAEPTASPDLIRPVARLPEPLAPIASPTAPAEALEPEFEHLMSRISSRSFQAHTAPAESHSKIAVFPHPATEPEQPHATPSSMTSANDFAASAQPQRPEPPAKPLWLAAVGSGLSPAARSIPTPATPPMTSSATSSPAAHSPAVPEIGPSLLRRFDPIVPLRDELSPWHQSLSRPEPAQPVDTRTDASPSSAPSLSSDDLWQPRPITFNRPAAPPVPATAPAPAAPQAPTPVAVEAVTSAPNTRDLSRRWGLLSQYAAGPDAQPTTSGASYREQS